MGFGPPPPGYFQPPPGQGFPPQNFSPNQQMPIGPPGHPMNQQRPPQQMPGQRPGSKQGTPQPTGSQGPTPVPPTQPKAGELPTAPASIPDAATGPPPPIDSKPPVAAATAPSAPIQAQQAAPRAAPKTNNRVAVPLPTAKAPQKPIATTTQQPTPPAALPSQQPQSIADATQAATAAVAAAMAKLGPANQTQQTPPQPATTTTDNLTQKVNQMRIQDQSRGRSRGRGGTSRGGRRESAQKNVDVPKEDFDFESANAKFNKQDLVKEAIASGSPIGSPPNGLTTDADAAAANSQPNGAAADMEKDITDEVVIPPAVTAISATAEKGYDKKSSFFDNISSDLKDRVEAQQQQQEGGGIDGRTARREERTKNVETFGQGSVDHSGGYRGGYRGRGRGRGYNNYRGGGYRGGRGGYENRGGGYRGGRGGPKVTGEPTFV